MVSCLCSKKTGWCLVALMLLAFHLQAVSLAALDYTQSSYIYYDSTGDGSNDDIRYLTPEFTVSYYGYDVPYRLGVTSDSIHVIDYTGTVSGSIAADPSGSIEQDMINQSLMRVFAYASPEIQNDIISTISSNPQYSAPLSPYSGVLGDLSVLLQDDDSDGTYNIADESYNSYVVVPEPASLFVLAGGWLAASVFRRRGN